MAKQQKFYVPGGTPAGFGVDYQGRLSQFGQANSMQVEQDKGKVTLSFLDVNEQPAPFVGTLVVLDEDGAILEKVPNLTDPKGVIPLAPATYLVVQKEAAPITLAFKGTKGDKFVIGAIVPSGRVEYSPTITL